ncbi:MAG: LysM peptidoglycan-binding domain-containing protein [Chloroflexota bacterium]|nr:LysM peptidoglycan-binding domain-containing protein [Chloroflexota bacterium]
MDHFRHTRLLTLALIIPFALIACTNPPAIPTPTAIVEAIITPSATPSLTPTVTLTPTVLVAATTTATLAPPTDTHTPSPTPGPVEYVIQPNDTLFFIIQQSPFNYRDFSVVSEILRLNNLIDADRLPPPGSTILIPLPTATPVPQGEEANATAQAAIPQVTTPTDATLTQHTIVEGETIIGIAQQYRTTLRVLSRLNPEIGFFGCDFDIISGGENCVVLLEVGQVINVPAPTPTPTLSPTPSGSETPTPTPTFAAPLVSFPPLDAAINSPIPFTLQWVSVGVLEPQQVYLVQIENITTGAQFNDITPATSFRIPAELVPSGGQPQRFRWRVSVAAQNAEGLYAVVGAEGVWRAFTWQGT